MKTWRGGKALALALNLVLASTAWAAIGEERGVLLSDLSAFALSEGEKGFAAEGFVVTLTEQGGLVVRVDGEGPLDEDGLSFAGALIGAATGYGEGIAEPVAQFLRERAGDLAGQGRQALGVEEFTWEFEVAEVTTALEGVEDGAPYVLAFSLFLSEVPEALFPEARHSLGPEDAEIVIREFSDFQCPFGARFAAETLPALKAELLASGEVRFEYHHFPLNSIHPNAQPAAEAAECVTAANDAEAFWTYHDALFGRMQAWAGLSEPEAYFVRLAEDLGLATEGVRACLDERPFAREVNESTRVAAEVLGLRGTPTVFVNGYRLANAFDLASYARLIALSRALAGEASDDPAEAD